MSDVVDKWVASLYSGDYADGFYICQRGHGHRIMDSKVIGIAPMSYEDCLQVAQRLDKERPGWEHYPVWRGPGRLDYNYTPPPRGDRPPENGV